MSSSSSAIFSGASRFSSDFSAWIDRAVAIASLPLSAIQRSKATLEAQSTALGGLNATVTAVQNAVSSLNSVAGLDSYSTTISNASVLSATVGAGAVNGTYTIKVTGLGAYSTAMSMDGLNTVTDPGTQTISSNPDPVYTLNGSLITPASNTLNDLVAAINNADLGIQATAVNIGTTAAPDYRLSLQSDKLDAVAMQLNDGTVDLFAGGAGNGSKATYEVNGVAAQPSDSRTITLAPGITANLVGEGTATVTVGHATEAISNALASFVNAYNAAVVELDKHRGVSGGALTGESIVTSVWEAIRGVGQYSGGTGGITSLADLGVGFDETVLGNLTFDTAVFSTATSGNFGQLQAFLGSATEGGFLKSATDLMNSLMDSTDGTLAVAANSVNAEITADGNKITAEQERIDELRKTLTAQMTAADVLVAALEQQSTYITNLFESMRIASELYK